MGHFKGALKGTLKGALRGDALVIEHSSSNLLFLQAFCPVHTFGGPLDSQAQVSDIGVTNKVNGGSDSCGMKSQVVGSGYSGSGLIIFISQLPSLYCERS